MNIFKYKTENHPLVEWLTPGFNIAFIISCPANYNTFKYFLIMKMKIVKVYYPSPHDFPVSGAIIN